MMTDEQFQPLYDKYKDVITAIAVKLVNGHSTLVDDLVQEGLIALANLDFSKITRNESSFVRQAVKFRMIDFLRKEAPSRYESLDAMLDMPEWELQWSDATNEPYFKHTRGDWKR